MTDGRSDYENWRVYKVRTVYERVRYKSQWNAIQAGVCTVVLVALWWGYFKQKKTDERV